MSAPTPAPGDDRPREGYYPDPSIPGYVRYWNGAAWVPGTSRPAPSDGEPLTPPPGGGQAAAPAAPVAPAAAQGPAAPPASVEETGPHFFDEDPNPAEQYGSRPEPASAWGADRAHQSGFGGDQDRRVSWGAPQGADPRAQPAAPAHPHGQSASTDGTATIPPAGPEGGPGADDVVSGGTFVFRRPTTGGAEPSAGPVADEGTVTFRAPGPRTGGRPGASGAHPGSTDSGPAFAPGGQGTPAAAGGSEAAGFGAPGSAGAPGTTPAGAAPAKPGFAAGKAAAERAAAAQAPPAQPAPAQQGPAGFHPGHPGQAAAQPPAQASPLAGHYGYPQPASNAPSAPSLPQQSGGPQPQVQPQPQPASPAAGQAPAPMAAGSGGGQSSWAQQVHQLAGAGGAGAGEEGPVAPWKPPVEDVFQAAARRQASARPAGLGKRLAARLVDTLVLAAVTAAAAVPLGVKALDHVNEKIDAAKLTGETVTVWLLDGTTSVYLAIVLGVLLLFGIVYEAVPTAKWGRTLGKKLFGLQVRDIEGGEPPSFGAALRRWLVYSVPGLLAVGVVGVVWGLFDKPWRQCWHDKAAHTFVAG